MNENGQTISPEDEQWIGRFRVLVLAATRFNEQRTPPTAFMLGVYFGLLLPGISAERAKEALEFLSRHTTPAGRELIRQIAEAWTKDQIQVVVRTEPQFGGN